MNKNIYLTITSPKYKVLGDFLQDPRSQGFPAELRLDKNKNSDQFNWQDYADQFVNFTLRDTVGLEGYRNIHSILDAFKNYPAKIKEIDKLFYSGNFLDIPLKPGIVFTVPIEKITKEALLVQGIELVSNNEPAFKAKALLDLEQDIGYKKVLEQDIDNSSLGGLQYSFPDITIWVWCRSLSENSNTELGGQIFNITPFVSNLQTSHTKTGSTFSFTLAPINAELDPETGQWMIKNHSVLENSDTQEILSTMSISESVSVNGKDQIVRNQYLFHNIIGTNDVVWIRYETLKLEEEQRSDDNSSFIVNKRELAGRIYDLIGLVDNNSVSAQFEANDLQIQISGRDLSKLFIEDGTYFYPYEAKQGVLHLQGGATRKNELTQRIINENSQLYLGLYYNNSIEEILKFVIQQLSTIKVVPDDLFSSYNNTKNTDGSTFDENFDPHRPDEIKDRRNQAVKSGAFASEENQKKLKANLEIRKQELQKKEQKLIQEVSNFREAEYLDLNEITLNTSSSVYFSLKEFITATLTSENEQGFKIAKIDSIRNSYFGWKKFVYKDEEIYEDIFPKDFLTDNPNTRMSLFNDMVDQPYRNANDAKDLLQKIYLQIKEETEFKKADFVQESFTVANGIWQIVKLVIDKKVAKRLLIDSSISSANGSLMNFLKKACQEPFVEIFFDTYGDQFYIIVRQPPTDKVGIQSYMLGNYQYNDPDIDLKNTGVNNLNQSDNSLTKPVIVSIKEIDVISDNLSFNDSNIYSWYHFVPQANFISGSEKFSTSFIPAVYFPEYSEIWGSKSLDLIHNYTNYYTQYSNENKSEGLSENNKQIYYDMKYIIDSNMYMPFARKGSIVMQGDRRMKVGNPVRLESTGEIFWIDSVSHSFSISNNDILRSTTIQVSRGLIEAFVYGVSGDILNTYFNNQSIKFSSSKVFSYFNIINTVLNFKTKTVDKFKNVQKKVPIDTPEAIVENEIDYQDSVIASENDVRLETSYVAVEDAIDPLKGVESEISKLHVSAQPHFRNFLKEVASLGWIPQVTSGKRSASEQTYLKKQNSKNASPETSKHVKGFALDLNFIAMRDVAGIKKGTRLIGGRTDQTRAYWNPVWKQTGIPAVADRLGIIWGGNYRNYKDNVHFELSTNYINATVQPTTEPQYKIITDRVKDGTQEVIDEQNIFSNFIVDKEIFNFFLRHQQFAYVQGSDNNMEIGNINDLQELPQVNIVSQEQLNNISTFEIKNIQETIIKNKTSN